MYMVKGGIHTMTKSDGSFASRVSAAGLSMSALARTTGVERSLLSEYATGRRVPSLATAEKLAVPLGVHPEEVVIDCLSDRWNKGPAMSPERLLEGERRPPALRALNSLRELSRVREASEEFRQQVERAGDLVLEALARELRPPEQTTPRRAKKRQ